MNSHDHRTPAQHIPVYCGSDLRVISGANEGDPLSFLDELELDDVYELRGGARRDRLAFRVPDGTADDHVGEGLPPHPRCYRITRDTGLGSPDAPLHLDALLTFMSPDGRNIEMLVLVETDTGGHVAEIYGFPLASLPADTPLTLVGKERESAQARLAQVACVSFTRGTQITMATGNQVPIEALAPGDKVLTRDGGAQEIRWIGHSTVRATGDFAPILIRAGVLNNDRDLLVSPDHRLFVYQRTDRIGAGQPELLVKARHLVNGDSVTVQDGGFVDYFQILFDHHHIIYAEGIAAESLLVDGRTRPALPADLVEKLRDLLGEHGRRSDHGMDVQQALLDRPDAIDLLREASLR